MTYQHQLWLIAGGIFLAAYLLWVACKHINKNWNGPTIPELDPEAEYNEYVSKTYYGGNPVDPDSIRWEG